MLWLVKKDTCFCFNLTALKLFTYRLHSFLSLCLIFVYLNRNVIIIDVISFILTIESILCFNLNLTLIGNLVVFSL